MENNFRSLIGFINKRLITVTLVSALLASIISSIYTLTEFNIALKPALFKKAESVADVVVEDVILAISVGIPVAQISGMEKYLDDTLAKYPELTFISVTDADQNFLYGSGNVPKDYSFDYSSENVANQTKEILQGGFVERLFFGMKELAALMPGSHSSSRVNQLHVSLVDNAQNIGFVHVGLDPSFIRSQLTDIFFDIAIVLIAVLLVSFEVVMVVVMFYVSGPLQESEDRLQRQANGDFSVGPDVSARGSIGHFIGTLDKDSVKLQNKFRDLMSRNGVDDESLNQSADKIESTAQNRLKKLAERFSLLKVLTSKQGSIMDARIPLFVFSFAEELQKSFMPLFVAEYYEPDAWFSKDVMLGLPISVFMFVIAAVTPFAGSWVDRWGQKRLFFCGLIPAIAGYIGCALATNINDIVIWRGVTALGYAIITISCQSYIAAVVSAENRAKGMAIFVGVLMTATMCGTALGAIIADRIGYQPVFFISAVLSAFAGFLAWRMLSSRLQEPVAKKDGTNKTSAWPLLCNVQFVGLVLFCAIPAKIILTGFLYYMVPLYLVSLDVTQSEIGRIMMVYSLVIIPLSPLASRIADQTGKMKELVILATLLSGGILISLYGEASLLRIFLAVTLMGAAHSILKAPLIATAIEAAEKTQGVGRTTAMGILRTSERVGSVLGPVIVAALLTFYDFGQAIAIVGIGVVIAGVLMAIYLKKSSTAKDEVVTP